MIGILFSKENPTSEAAAMRMLESQDFSEQGTGKWAWKRGDVALQEIPRNCVYAEDADSLGFETIYFLSSHGSGKGVPAFTTHAEGNWNGEAKLGGKPRELAIAAPLAMLSLLRLMQATGLEGVEKTYEATHHGPLIKTPSLFVESGGSEDDKRNRQRSDMLADLVLKSISEQKERAVEHSKVVIGIGGMHYPVKFNRLALEKGYAFAHIMPKHALYNADGSSNLGMLSQAIERSKPKPELAVVEWKSINSEARNNVIAKLNELGMEHERV